MKNSIPDKYIFSTELFRSIERSAMMDYGASSPDIVAVVIVNKMACETNTILFDLYQQILERIHQPKLIT